MSKSSNISKQQLEVITEVASKQAIQMYEKKARSEKKELKKRNLRNTELLLKNYVKLKDQCDESIEEVVPTDYPEFSLDSLTLESLSVYRAKTMKMMNHVDRMLTAYEWNCEKGTIEEQRRFKILKERYLTDEKMTVKEICKELNVEQGTVYRDTKISIKDMSVLLFGIDAVDFL
ncbi:helix-turn-helix domain-containing protein [Enterococcus sp. AZ196]|uniref:helix-turn-helix domain-containing protein n=1 Tax=Enterococcus sp. AZ196 TaxID=2774659 RepID=UPI003D28814F